MVVNVNSCADCEQCDVKDSEYAGCVNCEGKPNAPEFSIFKSVQRCNPYILFS